MPKYVLRNGDFVKVPSNVDRGITGGKIGLGAGFLAGSFLGYGLGEYISNYFGIENTAGRAAVDLASIVAAIPLSTAAGAVGGWLIGGLVIHPIIEKTEEYLIENPRQYIKRLNYFVIEQYKKGIF